MFRACPRARATGPAGRHTTSLIAFQRAPPAEIVLAVSNLVVDDTEIDAAAATSGSSFYLAMRILPAAQRDAMYQVYAFCRAVDDIADSDLPPAERAAGRMRIAR